MSFFGGGPSPDGRLARIERKLDLIIEHLGIEIPHELSPRVREALAKNRKIEAIKFHREETGLGLKESKDAIERYL